MVDFSTLAQIAGSTVGGAVGAGMLKGPITSLGDWWYYTFGNKTELKRQEAELLNQTKLEAYKQDIFNEVSRISTENIKEPQMNIIGPALEASKYYIDDPTLRKMFARLVASSMDASKENTTRTAFVEFVKQMTPIDAQLLLKISKSVDSVSIGKIKRNFGNERGYSIMRTEIFLSDFSNTFSSRISLPSAAINLSRMGLLEYTYNEFKTGIDANKAFSDTTEYLECEQVIERERQTFLPSLEAYNNGTLQMTDTQVSNVKKVVNSTLSVQPGLIKVTPLGEDFISICL